MLAPITYFIVTVIIGFVERAGVRQTWRPAAGMLVVGIECRLPARYTRRSFKYSTLCLFVNKHWSLNKQMRMTAANLDVFVGNDTLIDPDIYQLWLNGHSGLSVDKLYLICAL